MIVPPTALKQNKNAFARQMAFSSRHFHFSPLAKGVDGAAKQRRAGKKINWRI